MTSASAVARFLVPSKSENSIGGSCGSSSSSSSRVRQRRECCAPDQPLTLPKPEFALHPARWLARTSPSSVSVPLLPPSSPAPHAPPPPPQLPWPPLEGISFFRKAMRRRREARDGLASRSRTHVRYPCDGQLPAQRRRAVHQVAHRSWWRCPQGRPWRSCHRHRTDPSHRFHRSPLIAPCVSNSSVAGVAGRQRLQWGARGCTEGEHRARVTSGGRAGRARRLRSIVGQMQHFLHEKKARRTAVPPGQGGNGAAAC